VQPTHEFGPVRIYCGEKNGKYPDGNQVIVEGSDRRAVFDSPLVSNRIGPDFDEADLVIQGHMHEDHATGLHRLPDAPVYVHRGDLAATRSWEGLSRAYGYSAEGAQEIREKIERDFNYVARPDAIGYEDGHEWDLGGGVTVRAIHTPGHTAGHCALLVEPVGVVFIGDIDLSSFGPYYGDQSSSLTQFRETLALLPDIPARVWVTFHHRGVYTDREKFLEDLSAFTAVLDQRNQRLLEALELKAQTLDELSTIRLLYPPEFNEAWVKDVERHTIAQHLEELVVAGRVEQNPAGRYLPL